MIMKTRVWKKIMYILYIVTACLCVVPPAGADEVTSADSSHEEPLLAGEAEEPLSEKGSEDSSGEDGGEVRMMSGGEEPVAPPASPTLFGGAFSSLFSESFKTDPATGSASLQVPLVVPPGRKNIQPSLAFSYSSGNGNGVCGVGWVIGAMSIQRSTKKGVPRYNTIKDIIAGGQELVCISDNEYRARHESAFMRYIYYPSERRWVACDKSGTRYTFGSAASSRQAHPSNDSYIYAWFLDSVTDVYGNAMTYSYSEDSGQLYLDRIRYTANGECDPALPADKEVAFLYEDTERPDKIFSNRTGWQITTAKRLDKISASIDSDGDGVFAASECVWTYHLSYEVSPDTGRSLLKTVQLEDAEGMTLPPKTFTYQRLEP